MCSTSPCLPCCLYSTAILYKLRGQSVGNKFVRPLPPVNEQGAALRARGPRHYNANARRLPAVQCNYCNISTVVDVLHVISRIAIIIPIMLSSINISVTETDL